MSQVSRQVPLIARHRGLARTSKPAGHRVCREGERNAFRRKVERVPLGPLLYNFSAGRVGLRITARIAICTQLVSVLLLLSGTSTVVLALASFGGGLGMPALIAISLLRSQQITDGDPIRHRSLWGTATAYVAVGQAIAAFGTAFLIDQFGVGGLAYPLLFVTSATALGIAFAVDFAIRK